MATRQRTRARYRAAATEASAKRLLACRKELDPEGVLYSTTTRLATKRKLEVTDRDESYARAFKAWDEAMDRGILAVIYAENWDELQRREQERKEEQLKERLDHEEKIRSM